MNLIDKVVGYRDGSLLYRLFRENFRQHRRDYAAAIFCMVVMAGTTAASAWIMRDVTNNMVVERDLNKVLMVAGFIAIIFTLKGFATYFQTIFLARAGNAIIATQQIKMYDRLVNQGFAFYSSMASSNIQVVITQTPQSLRSVIEVIVTSFARDLVSLIGLIAVMFYQQPLFALLVIVVGPLILFWLRTLLAKVRTIMMLELASLGEIIRVVQETSQGFKVIKAFALEQRLSGQMGKAVHEVEDRSNSIVRIEAATGPFIETLTGFTIAGVVALSGYLVLKGSTTPGELMSFITALLLSYEPAKRLARVRVNIETAMVGVRLMYDFLDAPITLVESADATDLAVGPGEVVFDDVSFDYTSDVPVIRNIDVTFPAGKTTALVGPSGGGKSTTINLLMRLYDPTSGRVLIDGHDIAHATFRSLRQRISYVGQDTFLFAGTVAHNIGLGCEGASEEDIIEAAKAANAHEFISEMPLGYHNDVGENGRNLSGGQKQRIAIARAVLRNSEILILDEATSALDSHSEALVRDALQHLMQGRTTIVIAHRLSTITKADRVLFLNKGRIIEQGSLQELMDNEGPFRALHDKQLLTVGISRD